ncbi:unnamed protein product [Linum tenue]|uniref:Uncharacterized protein n=1 Tax=Linum tenue TaxID=586396 RepID=A0AAV0K7K6_9ROSI|nr:unnamed protein product [Linum tenue]
MGANDWEASTSTAPSLTFPRPDRDPTTPAAATDRRVTSRLPEHDGTTPDTYIHPLDILVARATSSASSTSTPPMAAANNRIRRVTFRLPELETRTPAGATYLHPLASLIARASSIISSLSTICHNVAMFCNEGWWVIKPSSMTTLALAASFPFFLYGYGTQSLKIECNGQLGSKLEEAPQSDSVLHG